jgi:hypothetical protein
MKYISLGPTCDIASLLKKLGVRDTAYPFDWVFTSFAMMEDAIKDRFNKFLDVNEIYEVVVGNESGSTNRRYSPMIHTQTLLVHHQSSKSVAEVAGEPAPWRLFNHHNLCDPQVNATFKRRCARFLDILSAESSEQVTLVYCNWYMDDIDDAIQFVENMAFLPHVRVLVIIENQTYNVEYEVTPLPNLRVVYTTSAERVLTATIAADALVQQ